MAVPLVTRQPNPFGAAKPREAVLAKRTGVDEKDLLAREAQQYESKVRTWLCLCGSFLALSSDTVQGLLHPRTL